MQLGAFSSRAFPGLRNGVARAMTSSACRATRRVHTALYSEYGEPVDVIKFQDLDMREPGPDEVTVDWLAVRQIPNLILKDSRTSCH